MNRCSAIAASNDSALKRRADGLRDDRELPVDFGGAGDHLVGQDVAELVRLVNRAADAVFALFQQLNELLAGRAAEQLVADANLRGLVKLLQPPDDLQQQRGRVFQLLLQFLGAVAEPGKGFRGRALAGDGELVAAQGQFLQPVDHGVDRDARLFRDDLPLLKHLAGHAGPLRLVADHGDAFRYAAKLGNDAGDAAGCDTTQEPARECFAVGADLSRGRGERLVDAVRRPDHVCFHLAGCALAVAPHAAICLAGRTAGFLHVLFKVADSRFEEHDKAFGVCFTGHDSPHAYAHASTSSSASS